MADNYKLLDFLDFFSCEESKEEKKNKVRRLVDGENFILFFQKNGEIYGAPEESRVVFAKMKNPDKDTPDGWIDDANFIAINLMRAMLGDKITQIFSNKDLKTIKVLDKDSIEDLLMKEPSKKKDANLQIKQSPEGKGMIKLKDKK
jgi:hypothetical protein